MEDVLNEVVSAEDLKVNTLEQLFSCPQHYIRLDLDDVASLLRQNADQMVTIIIRVGKLG